MSIVVRSNEPAVQAETPAVQVSEEKSLPVDKTAEQKEASDSDSEETDSKEDSDDFEGKESDEDSESKDEESDRSKKKSGSQRRKERAERAEAEVFRLRQMVEQMALKGAGDSKKEPVEPNKAAAGDGEPDPDSFDNHRDYVKAVARWEAKQLQAEERRESEAKAQAETQTKAIKTYLDRKAAFSEKTPDFEEAVEAVNGIVVSPTVQQLIIDSEQGPELTYELAKNPKELERISTLGPIAAAREIGRLEAKIARSSEDSKPESKKITKAPAPLSTVGTGGKGSASKSLYDSSISQSEYERMRMEQIKKRRQASL